MCTFNWCILVGSIGRGREEVTVEGLEQINNIGVLEEFTTLIDMNILAVTIRAMLREKISKPFDRSSFGDAAGTMFHSS